MADLNTQIQTQTPAAPTPAAPEVDKALSDALDKLIAERMKEAKPDAATQAIQTQTTQAAPTPQPIKVTLGGQIYTFENEQALSTALEEITRQRAAEDAAAAAKAKEPTTPTKWSEADMAKFVELLQANPEQAFDYVDEKRTGVKGGVQTVVKQLAVTMEQIWRDNTINRFKDRNPDFPETPESARVMDEVMREYAQPFTVQGLEATFALAKQRGRLKLDDKQTTTAANGAPNPWQPPPPPPRPGAGGSSASSNLPEEDFLAKFEQLSEKDMERFLRENHRRMQ